MDSGGEIMCNFFSFVTDPINHPAEYYFFDWEYRQSHLDDEGVDSHSHICARFKLDEDVCNKYEFNPLTKAFTVDQINSNRDDSEAAEKWANRQDFKEIVEPLIIKPIVKPFELPKVEQVTDEQIGWLKEWASVWALVGASVRDLVGASVRDLVGASVWDSVGSSVWALVGASVRDLVLTSVRDLVGASVWASVRASVWASFGAYFSSFFAINYKYNFSSVANLWNAGLVPSFDGKVWRLHSGKDAKIIYEWTPEEREDSE
ncbi:MAG: hypothetical protein RBT66_08130 [bacterium]|jgi:hypothetical protein|nr:hypothetical protein [bacterium]